MFKGDFDVALGDLNDLFEIFIVALLLCLSMGEKSGGAIAVNCLLAAGLTCFKIVSVVSGSKSS